MKLTFYITPEAENDLTHQFQWVSVGGQRSYRGTLSGGVRSTMVRLEKQPQLGRLRRFRSGELRGIRSVAVSKTFHAHLIFYRLESAQLVVFRVMHGARDLERRLIEPAS